MLVHDGIAVTHAEVQAMAAANLMYQLGREPDKYAAYNTAQLTHVHKTYETYFRRAQRQYGGS